MATITPTVTRDQADSKYTVTWTNVTAADACAAFSFEALAENITVEADDTTSWGGATLTMVGSNGGTGNACTAMNNSTASWTANALFSIRQRPASITPTFSGGVGQSVTVYMTVWFDD